MKKIDDSYNEFLSNSKKWVTERNFNLIIFNLLLLFLFLMRSAGYFHPFFTISVNFIIIAGLILSIILLGAGSRALFLFAFVFWIFASFLRVIKIDIWAERTTVYVYQALIVGIIMLIIEMAKEAKKGK